MGSLGIIFVGYLVLLPHVFYSWRDLIRPKGKKTRKERRNIRWNAGISAFLLVLLAALTAESFRNEFSLAWILMISSFVVVLLIWSVTFMRWAGRGRA